MKFLNGWKTATGVAGVVLAAVAPHYVAVVPAADQFVMGAFSLLTVLGIIHKVEKASQ